MTASSAAFAPMRANAFIRRRAILSRLNESGFVRMSEIAKEWHVSSITARRDIEALAQAGLVSRTRGGASRAIESSTAPVGDNLESSASRQMFDAAAALVKPGMTVGIAGGSSSQRLARALVGIPRLTVVTNALSVVHQLDENTSSSLDVNVIVLPGLLDDDGSTTGPPCVDAIRSLSFDLTYFSLAGFDGRAGVFSDTVAAGQIALAFSAASRRSVALVEAARWDVTGPYALRASMFNTLISDFEPTESERAALTNGAESELIVSQIPAA
jgi:DeoR family fructose operon transcriptional repressor